MTSEQLKEIKKWNKDKGHLVYAFDYVSLLLEEIEVMEKRLVHLDSNITIAFNFMKELIDINEQLRRDMKGISKDDSPSL